MPNTTATASALLTNTVGLHARPSVRLTQLAKSFAARVEVALGPEGPWVDAKSPVKTMKVKAPRGSTLHFRAHGTDAREAVRSLVTLVERRFDEPEEVAVNGSTDG